MSDRKIKKADVLSSISDARRQLQDLREGVLANDYEYITANSEVEHDAKTAGVHAFEWAHQQLGGVDE